MAGNRVISAVLTLKDKDFTATAKRTASTMSDFERRTRRSVSTVRDFGRSATSSFQSVASGAGSLVAAIGITSALSSGFNMVKNSIGSAFARIDTMEAFESTMTVLTGSTEKTKQALDETRDAVTGTAYGMDVAAKSVQDFVTRGMDIKDATKTLRQWGDAVAFYGDGSNDQLARVNDALAKMYSSGKVSMDQMNTLYDAGIDGVGTYAKAVGRDTASVQKDLSAGKISADDFISVVGKAFEEGTNGVVKIAGAAKEGGASWGSVFANMQAAVTRGTQNIILKIDEMLTSNGLPDMRTMVANFGKAFEDTLNKVVDQIPVVTQFLVGMYESAKPGLDYMKDTALPAIRDGIGFVVDKATDLYNFVSDNWSLIGPIVAGVAASIVTLKLGIIAISAVQTTWTAVTAAAQLAMGLLNGTIAISPLGWFAAIIGGVVAAGIVLYQNWDTVKQKTIELWDSIGGLEGAMSLILGPIGFLINAAMDLASNWDNTKTVWENVWSSIQQSAATSVNAVIGSINMLIATINKIPGVNVPIIPKVNWGSVQTSAPAPASSGPGAKGPTRMAFAVGTDRVPYDMTADIHKDEMIIPAKQSKILRSRGIGIDNIVDQPMTSMNLRTTNVQQVQSNQSGSSDGGLMAMIAQLIDKLNNQTGNEININVDARDKSIQEIVNELVPMLKLRMANM